MLRSLGKFICLLLVLVACVSMVGTSHAANEAMFVRNVGLLDADGTALYSVMLASGPKPLSKLVVTGNIPAGMEFVEAISAPPQTTAQAAKDTVSWQVNSIEANTILGPFTYRVRLKDKSGSAPQAAGATVTGTESTAVTAQAAAVPDKLEAFAESGTLNIDSKGTLNAKGESDLVPVGKTGILVYVPAEAVSKPTTLTFTRVKLDDKNAPTNQDNLWWCTVVSVTSNPEVALTKPIALLLPNRRTLTPGLSAQLFTHNGDGNWQKVVQAQSKGDPITFVSYPQNLAPSQAGNAFIAPNGNHIVIPQLDLNKSSAFFRVGVSSTDRTKATVNSSNLPTATLIDGTSNTALAIPYIEQENLIIAILIGIRK